jgi:hypothetical protein
MHYVRNYPHNDVISLLLNRRSIMCMVIDEGLTKNWRSLAVIQNCAASARWAQNQIILMRARPGASSGYRLRTAPGLNGVKSLIGWAVLKSLNSVFWTAKRQELVATYRPESFPFCSMIYILSMKTVNFETNSVYPILNYNRNIVAGCKWSTVSLQRGHNPGTRTLQTFCIQYRYKCDVFKKCKWNQLGSSTAKHLTLRHNGYVRTHNRDIHP